MHVQARSNPALSPADLAPFLEVLAADLGRGPVNIEGVTGAALELEGKFVFTVAHGFEQDAHDRLTGAGYDLEWTKDLYKEKIPPDQVTSDDPNQPGVLFDIVSRAKGSTEFGGRLIDHVLIGAFTDEPGRFYCQVTFVDSEWVSDGPPPDDD
jgi:hypothetical protein